MKCPHCGNNLIKHNTFDYECVNEECLIWKVHILFRCE